MLRTLISFAACALLAAPAFAQEPIPIAEVKRDAPVDFEKDVLPILKKNCIACHNSATHESDLILETPETIKKGGASGSAIEPNKAAESLLLMVASHQLEPVMPPADNKVNARPLTPEELGILKLWIDQGATGKVSGSAELKWQPLPPAVNPIYAVAVTPDGQFAACGRANQVFIYHIPSGQLVTRLSDPALVSSGIYSQPGVAHLDIVQSLAFSPDGYLLASGGYQEVKLWRRPTNVQERKLDLGGDVAAIAASADRKWLATASGNAIKLFDLAAGQPAGEFAGHAGPVTSLRFSADGSRLFSVSHDKTLRVWNTADRMQLAQIETPAEATALTLVGDGSRIATGHADNLIRLWTFAGAPPELKAEKDMAGHSGPISALETFPTAPTQILSASADATVRHWNTDNGQAMRQVNHGAPVVAIAIRPDGQQYASAGGNSAKLWNAQNGQPMGELKGDYRAQHRAAATNKSLEKARGRVAARKNELAAAEKDVPVKQEAAKKAAEALAAADKTLQEKAAAHQKALEAKTAADKAAEEAAAAAKAAAAKAAEAKAAAEKEPENKALADARAAAEKAAAEADANAKKLAEAANAAAKAVADADKPRQEAETAKAAAQRASDEAAEAARKATELVPQTKEALAAAEAAQQELEKLLQQAQQAAAATEKPVRAVAYSPDGAEVATAGDDHFVHTWNPADGAPLEVFEGHAAPVVALEFLAPRQLASASADKSAVVWNTLPDWTLERTIGGIGSGAFVDRIIALDFSPDGKLLATGGGEPSRSGELKVWNVADGQLVRELVDAHSDTVFGVDFSSDGKLLASSAADKFIKVFEVETGKFVRSFEGHTHHVLGVAWQDDGKLLASGGADNVIKVWNFETGEQQRTIQGFGKQVTSISFVGDTLNTVSASGDKTVRLHRVDNGQNLRNFGGATDYVHAAAATPNGKLVLGGGEDSSLFVWNGENGQVVRTFAPPTETPDAPQQAAR